MTKKSTKPSSRKRRVSSSKATPSAKSLKRSSDSVMMRFGRIEEMNRSFDIEALATTKGMPRSSALPGSWSRLTGVIEG